MPRSDSFVVVVVVLFLVNQKEFCLVNQKEFCLLQMPPHVGLHEEAGIKRRWKGKV